MLEIILQVFLLPYLVYGIPSNHTYTHWTSVECINQTSPQPGEGVECYPWLEWWFLWLSTGLVFVILCTLLSCVLCGDCISGCLAGLALAILPCITAPICCACICSACNGYRLVFYTSFLAHYFLPAVRSVGKGSQCFSGYTVVQATATESPAWPSTGLSTMPSPPPPSTPAPPARNP